MNGEFEGRVATRSETKIGQSTIKGRQIKTERMKDRKKEKENKIGRKTV